MVGTGRTENIRNGMYEENWDMLITYLSITAHMVSVSFIVDNLPFYYSPHFVSVFYC